MKIAHIDLIQVSFGALEKPFWNSIIKTSESGAGRIEIHTDDGLVGMAPCGTGAVTRTYLSRASRTACLHTPRVGTTKREKVLEKPLPSSRSM